MIEPFNAHSDQKQAEHFGEIFQGKAQLKDIWKRTIIQNIFNNLISNQLKYPSMISKKYKELQEINT